MTSSDRPPSRLTEQELPKMDVPPSHGMDVVLPAVARPTGGPSDPIVVVGASTGGTEAIKHFLMPMPADAPPILIAQHMPQMFTGPFAARLNTLCVMQVKEAVHDEPVKRGVVYIAPGHAHLLLGVRAGHYVCQLSEALPVNRHRPSVDVLFRSAANTGGRNMVGVILTGMGRDGALGLLELHRAGGYTVAQDEATCVVFGMPREAIAQGAVNEVLPLDEIGPHVLARLKR